jgi:hypothetical protein
LLDINREVQYMRNVGDFGPRLARALTRLMDGINNLAVNMAADPTRTVNPPPKIQALTVKTDGNGNVHAVITDNSPLQKGVNYFVEYSTNPAFFQAHVEHLGPGRTLRPMPLPANDDNGNPQSWYFRAYSQYPGGKPSAAVNFGGTIATAVAVGGSARLTLLSSTGSGTAQATGQQAGYGFGRVLFRPAPGPKRAA